MTAVALIGAFCANLAPLLGVVALCSRVPLLGASAESAAESWLEPVLEAPAEYCCGKLVASLFEVEFKVAVAAFSALVAPLWPFSWVPLPTMKLFCFLTMTGPVKFYVVCMLAIPDWDDGLFLIAELLPTELASPWMMFVPI